MSAEKEARYLKKVNSLNQGGLIRESQRVGFMADSSLIVGLVGFTELGIGAAYSASRGLPLTDLAGGVLVVSTILAAGKIMEHYLRKLNILIFVQMARSMRPQYSRMQRLMLSIAGHSD